MARDKEKVLRRDTAGEVQVNRAAVPIISKFQERGILLTDGKLWQACTASEKMAALQVMCGAKPRMTRRPRRR